MNYIFDVDGTLTISRRQMDREFANWFEHFATHHAVYLVTGSDRQKTLEQIPESIYNLCVRVYQCAGNDVWEGNKHIRSNDITLPQSILVELDKELHNSKFEIRTGEHYDYRPGLVNFSILGRGADRSQRESYRMWDHANHNNRSQIAYRLNKMFPNYNFQVAGETGIDITKVGYGKEQIVHDFGPHEKIEFFGDKMNPGGNDYDLALELAQSGQGIHQVKNWEDTWTILKKLLG